MSCTYIIVITSFLILLAVSMGSQRHLALSSDDLLSGMHHHVAQAVFSLPFAHVSGVQASHRLFSSKFSMLKSFNELY
jgi:hypothetical protein